MAHKHVELFPEIELCMLYNYQMRKFIHSLQSSISANSQSGQSTGINRVGKDTHLTKYLSGFSLIKEAHDDPRILALEQHMKTKRGFVKSAAIQLHCSTA